MADQQQSKVPYLDYLVLIVIISVFEWQNQRSFELKNALILAIGAAIWLLFFYDYLTNGRRHPYLHLIFWVLLFISLTMPAVMI